MPRKSGYAFVRPADDYITVRVKGDMRDALDLIAKADTKYDGKTIEQIIDDVLRSQLSRYVDAAARIKTVENEVLTQLKA